jgi:glycosyltransferase involved in cell wall biosynthesis
MRILHLINNLSGGGAEKLVFDIVSTNTSQHEFEVLTLNQKNDKYSQKLIDLGFKVHSINSKNPFKIISNIKNYSKNYDIVHSHLFPSFYYVVLCKFFSKKFPPIVFTEHSTTNRRRSIFFFKAIDNIIYSQFNRIVCISSAVRNSLVSWIRLSNNKIKLIFNGINLVSKEDIKKIKRHQIHPSLTYEDRLILIIGRLTYPKNHIYALKVIKMLPHSFKLLIVGEGELESSLKNTVKELNIENKVIFTGFKEDIYSILYLSDLVFIPSLWEGFGLIAVEALSLGRTIVCSNIVGLNEVVGDLAYKFDLNEFPENCVDIINFALKNPIDKTKLIERSKLFDIKTTIQRHLELYKEIL